MTRIAHFRRALPLNSITNAPERGEHSFEHSQHGKDVRFYSADTQTSFLSDLTSTHTPFEHKFQYYKQGEQVIFHNVDLNTHFKEYHRGR
jgi:hypothetical protein